MRRRLRQVVLPLLLLALIASICCLGLSFAIQASYRKAANREVATLVGKVVSKYPELDTAELMRTLQQNDSVPRAEFLARGEQVFQEYGYYPTDNFSASSLIYERGVIIIVLTGIIIVACGAMIIFWWRDWYNQRKLADLVEYLQQLHDHIYDLRLDQNVEGELSILTNELYKIMVALKQAAEQNQQRSRNLESALADISHQLRTPLTSIQAMIDNIYEDPEMPAAVRQDFLRSSSRQISTMSDLVMTLLNLAKFDNGSIRLADQVVSAKVLVNQVKQNLEVLADLQDVTLEIAGDLTAQIKLDLRWQTEALTNIVKNCIEHSPAGEKVIIAVEDCPLFLRVVIEDFGEGIAPTDLKHIFERFYKAKNATAESVGIGLAFAKAIIEADGGQVKVSSVEGQGTKFIVTYFKN